MHADSSLERPCRVALHIRRDLLEATVHEAAQSRLSVASFVAQALRKELERRQDLPPKPPEPDRGARP